MNIPSILSHLSSLKQQHSTKQTLLQEISSKIDEVNNIKNDNISFLRKVTYVMERKYDKIIQDLLSYKQNIETDMKYIEAQIEELCEGCWKGKVIDENKVKYDLNEIKMNGIMKMKLSLFDGMELFKKQEFKVEFERCKEMLGKDLLVMYNKIYVDLLKVAVCFFPNGNMEGKNEYVSLYLYVLNDIPEGEAVVLKINFSMLGEKEKNYEKNFYSMFTREEKCKGIMRFYKIKDLEKDGFINKDGTLCLIFGISFIKINPIIKNEINKLNTF